MLEIGSCIKVWQSHVSSSRHDKAPGFFELLIEAICYDDAVINWEIPFWASKALTIF